MKNHDSITQADQKLALAIKQLQKWCLPATPINYAVSYEYINDKNATLTALINQQLSSEKPLDNFFLDEVYRQILLGGDQFRDEIISDIDNVIEQVKISSKKSSQQAEQFITDVDKHSESLYSQDHQQIKQALLSIHKASRNFKLQQEKLNLQLQQSKVQTVTLKNELQEIRKEIYLDPLTGLYNRKALNKHIEDWIKQDPKKNLAAIVINVDQLQQVTEKFGGLISDVLLAKIANKVTSYVGESGLPVRSSGDEFTILLPEIDSLAASEIAEKIRQGVERLRFVSSKTGIRLPKMTISLAVNTFDLTKNVHSAINQTRALITKMQQSSQYNQIAVAS
ncbi:GGDEF domain-containing protein [Thalassotalea profundi]|uniref:diguanylate cyclase n=1 Tax=Thalassotalea profundi TaxID=2036687 RepID=A0ABQ3IRC4_9GAMM|nr:GGDEF domain-containing protein [Thalassotalea profundi]GHE88678.1 diguanylate cyclase [Thalassotalea profundi]